MLLSDEISVGCDKTVVADSIIVINIIIRKYLPTLFNLFNLFSNIY